MPDMTPLTPPTTAPADRLDVTESSVRAAGVEALTISHYSTCFSDND
jgi:hypothetical protein